MEKLQRIQVGKASEKLALSKAQREFNGLAKRIEKTEEALRLLRSSADQIQQRVQQEYWPGVKKLSALQVRLVHQYDRFYGHPELKNAEKKKLAYLIRELAFELIDGQGIEELKPLYDKYDTQGFDGYRQALADQALAQARQKAARILNISPDDIDLNDLAAIQAFLDQKLQEQDQAVAEQIRQGAEEQGSRPRSEKQQAREARRAEEARQITRSVRTLYMDLVKAFHPDREFDELEKARKTDIMQRVITAYENRDLMALLRLQLEFNCIDQAHLETLADVQLAYYNKILKDQAEDLDAELHALQLRLGQMFGSAFGFIHSAVSLEFSLNTSLAQLKRAIKALKSDLELFTQVDMLRLWLKEYQIPPLEIAGSFNSKE